MFVRLLRTPAEHGRNRARTYIGRANTFFKCRNVSEHDLIRIPLAHIGKKAGSIELVRAQSTCGIERDHVDAKAHELIDSRHVGCDEHPTIIVAGARTAYERNTRRCADLLNILNALPSHCDCSARLGCLREQRAMLW